MGDRVVDLYDWRVGSLESVALVVSGMTLWTRTYIMSLFRSKGGGMH